MTCSAKPKNAPASVVVAAAAALLFSSAGVAHAATARTMEPGALAGRLHGLMDGKFAAVQMGVVVIDLDSGRTLFDRGGDLLLKPASNQKLVTTAAALALLGPDAKLETALHERGKLGAGGVLEGDLILKGGGDPNLSGRFFDGDTLYVLREFARAVKSRGITRVKGDLVIDPHVFDGELVHPTWPKDQLGRWYAAPVAGICLNDNCLDVMVAPGGSGRQARVWLEPIQSATTGGLIADVDTRPRTKRPKNQLRISRQPTGEVKVSGWIDDGSPTFRDYLTVTDPARFCGDALLECLQREMIVIDGTVRIAQAPVDVSKLVCLARSESPLSVILDVTNTRSQNLYAECLLKTLGARVEGEGSWAGGARAAGRYLARFGARVSGFQIADGSGLSSANRASAFGLVSMLADTHQGRGRDMFIASLARSGARDGSMRSRLTGAGEKNRIAAKTGHIHDVNTLSGFVLDKDGKARVAFSMLANGFLKAGISSKQVGDQHDSMCRALLAFVDGR